jgi:Animal haem peroxidase
VPGVMAEDFPQGFAFSDTAFRIFILMASRRLNSDRFFTGSFTDEVYTSEGMTWIADNTMRTVLVRHCPDLETTVAQLPNAFAIWDRTAAK